jgi:hypothetical protein
MSAARHLLCDEFVAEEFATAQQGLDMTTYQTLVTEGGDV